ncbi:hypothetical protein DOJK_00319 [Patescibacteria group bacterium]|jgi:hypothetical protein|nr:hypothetical protein DOJK_00319 [Patescibacteria group bacterium]
MNKEKDVKKQHYVPQVYLRRFSIKNQINVLDKFNDKSYPSNIKDVAEENRFYDIPIPSEIIELAKKSGIEIDHQFVF